VRATVSDSASVIKDVEKGRATLGFIGQEAENPALATRSIGQDSLVLVVPLGHAWATRRSIALDGLAGEPLIIREPGSGSRSTLEKGLERAGASLAGLNVSLELGSNTAIKDAVKRGLGIAFLSRFCVRRELDSREFHAVGVRRLDLTRRFYLVHHRRRPLSMAANAFMRFVESRPIDQGAAKAKRS
jgi:DNA-binding transcriptional LysR family regulator